MIELLNGKRVRIGLGLILLIILILSVVPSLYMYSSSDGVINARTTTLRSPIEGILHYDSVTRTGKFFKKDSIIGKVTNDRVNYGPLHEFQTEEKTLESRIEELTDRVNKYLDLNNNLSLSFEKYKTFSINQINLIINQSEFRLSQEEAEYNRAKKEFEANKILEGKDAVKRRELERTESDFMKSSGRIMEIKHKLAELKNSLTALQSGVFLGDSGNNDSPYSKQRMDQLVIEISLAKTALGESKRRLEGIKQQIETEKKRIQKAESFELYAPFDAVAWRVPATEGSTVVIGSELIVLLDCSSAFLDIAVSESQFANIKPGDKIQFRMIGDASFHAGFIQALRGSGSDINDANLAASLSKDTKKEFRIWIQIDYTKLDFKPENFFQVGRRVEVKIPRKFNPLRETARFLNVF